MAPGLVWLHGLFLFLLMELNVTKCVSHVIWGSIGVFPTLRSWLIPDELLSFSEPDFSSVI